ncbi:MAG: ABC transporter substrate-binding protein [Verrucomicrobia bacterium]|nr:ABC transporter substrate-binding protein [Verrucomicrobiota bacterium]
MRRFKLWTIRLMVLAAVGLGFSGCGRGGLDSGADGLFVVNFQLDWVPEPQHGGLFMADMLGYFAEEGILVNIIPGGPGSNSLSRVATGRAELAQAEGNNTIVAAAEGLPVRIVGALFQHDPSVLMFHASNPIQDFADLNGQLLRARPEWTFLEFLQRRHGVSFRLAPATGGMEQLAADPSAIQQGYYIAEPYYLARMGVSLQWLHVWDAGYDGISAVVANADFARRHPDKLAAFMRAYYRGQVAYFEGSPELAHARMLDMNPNATESFLLWSRDRIIEQNIAKGDAARGSDTDYLLLSRARIEKQIAQLVELGLLTENQLDADDVWVRINLPVRY